MSAKNPTEIFERQTETVVEPSEVRSRGPARFAQPPASSEGLVGSIVAERYLVHELLGAGGMGEVYVAEHVHMKKRVALKVLHGKLVQSSDMVQRFEREAIAAGRIRHPGVVTATDFGPLPDGSFYLALELIEGRSLSEELQSVRTMDEERVFGIVFQIAAALEAAHAAGIVHRDLKPENVMLAASADDEDFVKVLDFGIAKIQGGVSEGPALTRAGMIFGTPEYMSPEQARGESVDERSDLYALGMIAYELLSGKTAFENVDLVTVLRGQMLESPAPLPERVDERLATLVLRLLEKDPTKRPGSATVLLGELFELAETSRWALPEPKTAVGTRVDLRASRAFDVVPWSRAPRSVLIQPLQSLRALSMHPVSLGPRKVPLWLPALGLTVGLLCGALWIRSGSGESLSRTGANTSLDQRRADLVALPALGKVKEGDREAIGELRRSLTLAEQSRLAAGRALTATELEKLAEAEAALGRGYSALKLFVPAIAAYGAAIDRRPSLRDDRRMLADVLRALDDKDAFDDAIRFCVTKLGGAGADLIYEAFSRVRERPDSARVRERLARALRAPDVRSVASPGLEVALELERAKVCAEYRGSLAEHGENADARSLAKLEALSTQRGCGKDARFDCFPCLRGEGSKLPAALAAARTKPSPKWDDL